MRGRARSAACADRLALERAKEPTNRLTKHRIWRSSAAQKEKIHTSRAEIRDLLTAPQSLPPVRRAFRDAYNAVW
jgi:hypothetical protein